ncbi:LysR family transcriptional regulator [Citrobacter sp. R-1.5.2]|uniref:LysR family transcriptional regulator n=1 Tax=Citrobacter sp. R-1.5.2 TaxID=3046183 RepID=UPI002B24EDE9|nr:LysR family transcriptional regulator [Citrobacter sp. R-1.5.2]MEB2418084.1 LysR family transcriptional regulator [Citrobacter sp. R-1.5.2]
MSKASDAEKIRTLSKIDLNLLTIFCLIYSVGSISRVADMLNISPSAVSQSLRKLREMMGDNLFVRSGNALLPTVYSDELYDNTIPIIDKLSTLMPLSSPAAKKRLTLYTESFISPIVIPDVTARIINTDADISLLHLTADLNEQSIVELLNMRQADVVFSTFSVESGNITCQKISDMRLVLVASQNNTLYGNAITEEQFRSANLVGYNTKNEKIIYHRSIVDKKFRTGERCLLTSSFTAILTIVSTTQCLGVIPEKVFVTHAHLYGLKKINTPFPLPQFSVFSSSRKDGAAHKILSPILTDLQTTSR